MKKILYINGCSHSCGAEIEYKNSFRTQFDLDNCFGGLIADRYKIPYHNDAWRAQSNKAIYSSSVFSLLNLLKIYDPSEIFVLIGWSGYERTEVVYDDRLYRICANLPQDHNPRYIQKFYKSWVIRANGDVWRNDFSLWYFAMKNFLDLYKIDYLFFNAVHSISEPPKKNLLHISSNNQADQNLFEIIRNDKNFVEPFSEDHSFYMRMKKKYDPLEGGRYHHFGIEAHKEWADILIPYVDKKLT